MKQISLKIGKVLLIALIVVIAIYLTLTAERAMDYFNIGADNS